MTKPSGWNDVLRSAHFTSRNDVLRTIDLEKRNDVLWFAPERCPADCHLSSVNRANQLTYAASISANGLELFFTRAKRTGGIPTVYRATRSGPDKPFRHVQPVAAITGFAEAPTLSADGTTLYYHRLVGSTFQIWSVTRS
jgi:hypothetical protein